METNKKVIAESSFVRGWSQVPPCYRDEIKGKLMVIFGIVSDGQFYARMRGEVEPRKSQVPAIEDVFGMFGVTDIWGSEPFNKKS